MSPHSDLYVIAGDLAAQGGKHYGHMEIDVYRSTATSKWFCKMTPVYIFVSQDKSGITNGFDRREYNDPYLPREPLVLTVQ